MLLDHQIFMEEMDKTIRDELQRATAGLWTSAPIINKFFIGDDDEDIGWLLGGERGGEEGESEENGEMAHGGKRKTPGWFE
jgi:hypothetical protein